MGTVAEFLALESSSRVWNVRSDVYFDVSHFDVVWDCAGVESQSHVFSGYLFSFRILILCTLTMFYSESPNIYSSERCRKSFGNYTFHSLEFCGH